ncbi:MAG: hypothetical protein WAZ40_03115 [Minisyncoccia bacterium]
MIDKTDIILYGSGALVFIGGVYLGYRFFRKKKDTKEAEKPKNEVMNKIQDFYSTQGK